MLKYSRLVECLIVGIASVVRNYFDAKASIALFLSDCSNLSLHGVSTKSTSAMKDFSYDECFFDVASYWYLSAKLHGFWSIKVSGVARNKAGNLTVIKNGRR